MSGRIMRINMPLASRFFSEVRQHEKGQRIDLSKCIKHKKNEINNLIRRIDNDLSVK